MSSLPTAQSEAPELDQEALFSGEFLNRDLSWLEFNRRVLHEAADSRTPLLERVRFLAIFGSNLDEFFMKRVGALRGEASETTPRGSADALSPLRQLQAIRRTVLELQRQQAQCYVGQIRPELQAHGIHLLAWDQLGAAERQEARAFFRSSVFPILTPLAVDPGHPFPFISNLSESVGVTVQHPDRKENLFARIKVPKVLPRLIRLTADNGQGGYRFYSLYDLIRHNLQDLFPDMRIVQVMFFRVTRGAMLDIDDADGDDLRELVIRELRQRRFAPVVRLEVAPRPDAEMLRLLMQELELDEEDVYPAEGELNYADLLPLADLRVPGLRHEPWTPQVPPSLADEERDIFSQIRSGDLLVHHPYESFSASVERFIKSASVDPRVLAIKMTLYRTGGESSFIHSLIQAAEAGKQVVCMVEVKARFDEERNLVLADALESAGVHVVYGMLGLKTHVKAALVVRQEPDGIRCYAHIGTGNYHAQTARLYTDLGLFTCNPVMTADLVELFHYLTGRSLKREYGKLLVAPVNMRDRFLELIGREIEHARANRPARIVAKMNSLEDRRVVKALYEASEAGVRIDLLVRGFCCLRPGVPGLSEHIRVSSTIGRFLEHSRIFYFRNGREEPADGDFFIGSADWMYRNLLARVEVVAPVECRPLRARCWEILQIMLDDQRQSWDMQADGRYVQRQPASTDQKGAQERLMELTRQRCAAGSLQRPAAEAPAGLPA